MCHSLPAVSASLPRPVMRGVRVTILVALWLGLCLPGFAIERVFRVSNQSTEGNSVFRDPDGYVVLANHNGWINFTKFSTTGDVVYSRDVYFAGRDDTTHVGGFPHTAIRLADGGFIVAGLIQPRPQKGFLLRLNANLTLAWGKVLSHAWGASYDLWLGGVRHTSDGGYVLLVKGQAPDRFIGVVKLTSGGVESWQKRIVLGMPGSDVQTDAYDVYETGGAYIVYGGIRVRDIDTNFDPGWDLYFAGVSKNGNELYWDWIIGGGDFDGAYDIDPVIYPCASSIVALDGGQLGVAAYTRSFGRNPDATGSAPTTGKAIMLVSFPSSGNFYNVGTGATYVTPTLLDGESNDLVGGPYGGPNLIRTSAGRIILAGHTESPYPGFLLTDLGPDLLSLRWQHVHPAKSEVVAKGSGVIWGVCEDPATGNLLCAGKTGGDDTDAVLMVTSASGESEWSAYHQFDSELDYTLINSGLSISKGASAFDDRYADGLVQLEDMQAPAQFSCTVTVTAAARITAPTDAKVFGDVGVGATSVAQDITISNPGNGYLVLNPFSLEGDQAFALDWGGGNPQPQYVDPGQTATFHVRFLPTSAGTKAATLKIKYNFPDISSIDVPLQGTGVNAAPDAFAFADLTGAPFSTVVSSAPITVSGITVPVAISIVGGQYSVNGGAFTAVAGTVSNGDAVRVQVTSAAGPLATVSATLTIGGVSDVFSVTTVAGDTEPDAFAFGAQTGVALSAVVISNAITVSGIDSPAPITVANGEYSINGGAFTAVAGTVSSGNTVRVRGTASATY